MRADLCLSAGDTLSRRRGRGSSSRLPRQAVNLTGFPTTAARLLASVLVAPLAQLAEQLTLNQRVGGSIPSRRTVCAGHRSAGWRSSFREGRYPHLTHIFALQVLTVQAEFGSAKSLLECLNSTTVHELAAHVDVLGHRRPSVTQLVGDDTCGEPCLV